LIDIEHVISVIESHESRIHGVRFRCENSTGKPTPSRDLFKLQDRDFGRVTSDVTFDIERMRFRVTLLTQQNARSIDDTGKVRHGVSINEQAMSSNGIEWRRYIRPIESKTLDVGMDDWSSRITRDGLICESSEEVIHAEGGGVIKHYGSRLGVGWMTPFICTPGDPPSKLTEFIRSRVSNPSFHAECATTENGHWLIWLGTRRDAVPTAGLLIDYEPTIGRIASIELGPSDRVGNSATFPFWRIHYQYHGDHDILPSSVFYLPPPEGGSAALWDFDSVELNPDFANESFTVEFPDGTEVTDHISKQLYVIGKGLKDDDRAVAEFLKRVQKIKPPPIAPPHSWRLKFLYANLGILAAVLVIGVAFRIRVKRSRSATVLLITLFAHPLISRADDAGWTHTLNNGVTVHRSHESATHPDPGTHELARLDPNTAPADRRSGWHLLRPS